MDINTWELMENLAEGLYLTDLDRRVTFWNKAAERITGYRAEEVLGKPCSADILVHVDEQGRSLCRGLCPLAKTILDGERREDILYLHHRDGHRIPVKTWLSPLRDLSGAIVGGAELFSDRSSEHDLLNHLEELRRLALADHLTGLSNRTHAEGELHARLEEQRRYGASFAVLFLDVDHFKKVNDTYGHDLGDLVLKTVSNTLRATSRPYDLFARWGGEEFLGILRNVQDLPMLRAIAERCRHLVATTRVPLENTFLTVTISLGGTLAVPGDTSGTVLKRADDLLYRSKQEGRNRLTIDGD